MYGEPDQLVICSACRLPLGPFRDGDGRTLDVLDCDCHRISNQTEAVLPAWRSIHEWETIGRRCDRGTICHLCAAVWVADTSRFASWFCRDCAPTVRELNATVGRLVVPLGRHSLVNQVGARPTTISPAVQAAASRLKNAGRSDEPGSVADALASTLSAIDRGLLRLRRHLAAEIGRIIARSTVERGLVWDGGDHPLDTYLAWASAERDGSGAALERLAAGWHNALPLPPSTERRLP